MNAPSAEAHHPVKAGGRAGAGRPELIDPRGDGPIRAERLGLEGLEARAGRLAAACVLAPPRRARSPLLRRFVENKRVLHEVHRRLVALGDRRSLPGIDAEWLVDNFHIIADSLREVRHDLPPGYDELLPKLAVAAAGRLSPRLCAGPGAGGPLRQRARRGADRPVRPDLPADRPADHRRALGPADDAPPRAAREPPPAGRADDLGLGGTPTRRASGRPTSWPAPGFVPWPARRRRTRRPSRRGRLPAQPPAPAAEPLPPLRRADRPVRRPADAAPARPGRGRRHLRPPRGRARRAGLGSQRGPPPRAPSPGRQPGHRRQLRAQPPPALGRSTGTPSSSRAAASRRSSARTPAASTRSRTSPPATGIAGSSRPSPAARAPTRSRSPAAPSSWPAARPGPAAGSGRRPPPATRAAGHVGYYLVDRGRPELEAAFGYRPGLRERLFGWVLRHPGDDLLRLDRGGVRRARGDGRAHGAGARPSRRGGSCRRSLILLLPLSELAVGLVNHLLTLFLPPRVLPKLAFKEGIPAEHATFIVIPGMLARASSAAVLVERLETHYLSNPDPSLRFALLTDFADELNEHHAPGRRADPRRARAHRRASTNATAMPTRLAPSPAGRPRPMGTARPCVVVGDGQVPRAEVPAGDRFFLFHRRRIWNASQGCWMGWERKRGKLLEFNRLLRGARDTSYSVLSSDPCEPAEDPLRHHARRRHPDAARRGRPAGRGDGARA